MNDEQHKALQRPFDPSQIGKLPRAGIQLDYVGHAQVTARLLEVDPEWSWEPVAFDSDGLPAIVVEQDGRRVLWIRLTIGGVTRLGVGIVGNGKPEVEKELIGDALRNAAMRFGVALDLWAKGDLHGEDNRALPPEPIDWVGLGWNDQQEHDDSRLLMGERARALPESEQESLKGWIAERGWSLPYSSDEMVEWSAHLDELEASDGE